MVKAPRYEFVDTLRGLAALGVVASHTDFGPQWNAMNILGARGVQLFYVVSAFTLFLSLSAKVDKERHPFVDFFVRRFFRIAPLFFVAVAFYLWWNGFGPRSFAPHGIETWHVLATLAFVNGFHPETINSIVPGGWSIAVEMVFYLFVPLCFLWINSLPRALVTATAITFVGVVASRIARVWLLNVFPPEQTTLIDYYVELWLPSQAGVFALGFVLYFLFRAAHESPPSPQRPRVALALAVVSTYLMLAFTRADVRLIPNHVLFGIAFLALAFALSLQPFALLVNKVTRYLGKVSYSMYLTHTLGIHAAAALLASLLPAATPLSGLAVFGLGVVFTVALSTASFFLIEQPGQTLGRRIVDRIEAR